MRFPTRRSDRTVAPLTSAIGGSTDRRTKGLRSTTPVETASGDPFGQRFDVDGNVREFGHGLRTTSVLPAIAAILASKGAGTSSFGGRQDAGPLGGVTSDEKLAAASAALYVVGLPAPWDTLLDLASPCAGAGGVLSNGRSRVFERGHPTRRSARFARSHPRRAQTSGDRFDPQACRDPAGFPDPDPRTAAHQRHARRSSTSSI